MLRKPLTDGLSRRFFLKNVLEKDAKIPPGYSVEEIYEMWDKNSEESFVLLTLAADMGYKKAISILMTYCFKDDFSILDATWDKVKFFYEKKTGKYSTHLHHFKTDQKYEESMEMGCGLSYAYEYKKNGNISYLWEAAICEDYPHAHVQLLEYYCDKNILLDAYALFYEIKTRFAFLSKYITKKHLLQLLCYVEPIPSQKNVDVPQNVEDIRLSDEVYLSKSMFQIRLIERYFYKNVRVAYKLFYNIKTKHRVLLKYIKKTYLLQFLRYVKPIPSQRKNLFFPFTKDY